MAEIAGVTIDFTDYVASTTPRVLHIPAAHGDASAQDLWDTLSAEAAKLDNLIYKKLINRPGGGGKSTIGVGKTTGITLAMNNIQIQFEPIVVKLETGTVTTPDTSGTVLNDAAATFQTNLVERGDIILNATDGSHGTVLRVNSETQLVGTVLMGGTDDQFDSADAYEILDHVKRSVLDGDVIAEDDVGDPIDAILTSFGVDSIVELSTSPGLVDGKGLTAAEAAQLKDLWQIEGHDPANPMTVTPTSRTAGTMSETISGDGETTTTVTRTT